MFTFETLEFYRGMSSKYSLDHPSIISTRKDRNPKDTSLEVHNAADAWFERKFGVKYRSQAVFLTSRLPIARKYGATPEHAFRILPLGQYSFCWSPATEDMLSLVYNGVRPEDCPDKLESAQYTESDLKRAHESGHELMLYCERYIAVPISLCGRRDDVLKESSIIIV